MREKLIDLIIDSYLHEIKEKEKAEDYYSVRRINAIVTDLGKAKMSIHAYNAVYDKTLKPCAIAPR